MPDTFHYAGPIRGRVDNQQQPAFPWERLNGHPIIYASLGTVVNRHRDVYRIIEEACSDVLPAQLVLSLGGAELLESFLQAKGSAIVVKFAPQRAILNKAALTITHAGLNSTLESLSEGVPMVAIPVIFEQPAIAARIRWTGTGEFIRAGKLKNARQLRSKITQVLENPSYRESAARHKAAIAKTDGCQRAVEIIERVIETKRPYSARSVVLPKALARPAE